MESASIFAKQTQLALVFRRAFHSYGPQLPSISLQLPEEKQTALGNERRWKTNSWTDSYAYCLGNSMRHSCQLGRCLVLSSAFSCGSRSVLLSDVWSLASDSARLQMGITCQTHRTYSMHPDE